MVGNLRLVILIFILRNCRRRNFSLVARYSLKFTRCLFLVVKSLVTSCKTGSLLVAKVARCKKITRHSLQKLLVSKNHSLLYSGENSPATRCRNCSLENITRYSLQNSLVTCCRNCFLQKITRYSLQNSLAARCSSGVIFCYVIKKNVSSAGVFLLVFAKFKNSYF